MVNNLISREERESEGILSHLQEVFHPVPLNGQRQQIRALGRVGQVLASVTQVSGAKRKTGGTPRLGKGGRPRARTITKGKNTLHSQ
jgi:hypothetical protein